MSPSPSRFQQLPYSIVEVIVNYLLPTSNIAGSNNALAIMHSCHIWRTIYMRVYLSSLVFSFTKQSKAKFSFNMLPQFASPLIYPINMFVRTLTINIGSWEPLMSGEILEWMQASSVFASANLTSVTTLAIYAYSFSDIYTYDQSKALVEVINVAAFFKHVKSLIPNVKNVKLMLSKCDEWLRADRNTKLIEESIAELIYGRNVTIVKTQSNISNVSITEFNPASFSVLTSISLHADPLEFYNRTIIWGYLLSRHNAKTLQSLKLDSFELAKLELFLFKDDAPIIYSALVKMDIKFMDPFLELYEPVNPISSKYSEIQANHFPVLESLKFYGSYRVAIGCLFGSLNKSIEHLDATISPGLPYQSDANRPRLADLTRFCSLKTIKFAVANTCDINKYFAHKKMCSDIFKSFSSSSTAIYDVSIGFSDSSVLLEILDNNNSWAALRELDIKRYKCSLLDIINILTRAPVLLRLICPLNEETPEIDGVNMIKAPEFLKKHHYPLSKSLLNFYISCNKHLNDTSIYNITWYVVLLASVCPKLVNFGLGQFTKGKTYFCSVYFNIYDYIDITEAADSLYQELVDEFNYT